MDNQEINLENIIWLNWNDEPEKKGIIVVEQKEGWYSVLYLTDFTRL